MTKFLFATETENTSDKMSQFFIETLLVTPNRFRPESLMNGQVYLHGHTVLYTKIIQINQEIKELASQTQEGQTEDLYKRLLSKWFEL